MTGAHGPDCAETRGDSTGASLGTKIVDILVCCATTGAHGLYLC